MKLGSILAGTALRFAAREAVVCGDRRMTFAELDRRSNRIANALLRHGLKPGDRVAIYVPNSAELVEAMAGTVKMGALVVPISTRLTPLEVKFIFEDSRPIAIFISPEFREAARVAAARLDRPLIIVTEGTAAPQELALADLVAEGAETQPPYLPLEPDHCIIAYTSGTTGHPKGAIGTHTSIAMLAAFRNLIEFGLTENDTVLVTTPMAHRIGFGRMCNMFASGCRLVIMTRFDAKAAVDLIERERVTVLGAVPTIVRLLMPEFQRRPEAMQSLRLVTATGEVFPADLKERLFAALPRVGLYTFFAGTECGTVASLRPDEQRRHPDAMGLPMPGVEIRIVDGELRDVPNGTAGEMLVRCGLPGMGSTMLEYFNNPQATAEAFVDGWLRTGDMARRDDEGYLYFVDRVKDMVVSGGLNIYSKEVELALLEHPAVADAAVIGVPDAEFGEAVMAYVEMKPGRTASAEALIAVCRDRIAGYKKPKHIRFVETLPRTGTGKVMKGQLRQRAAAETA